jgi:hypothetical protein
LPADELSNRKRTAKIWHPPAQIVFETGFIETMARADWCNVILDRHYFALPI